MNKYGILLAALMASCSYGNNYPQSDEQLQLKIRAAIAPLRTMNRGYRILNMDSLANFAWDSVYYFNGEEGERHISYTIGFPWQGPEVYGLHKRLLFVHKKKVVSFADFNQEGTSEDEANWPLHIHLIVCSKNSRAVCARKDAKFIVLRDSIDSRVIYQLIPISCKEVYHELINRVCPPATPDSLTNSTTTARQDN